ncbi:MAG TPA: trigger factor, partial [Allosphingosinicella sp.]|nr:trigger factor [Allosphingosinicella sp.]
AEAIDAAVARLAEGQKSYDPAPAAHKAAKGDLVVIDFEGKVDGEPFDGGKGEGMSLELGSGRLIPGFEDQLIGARANDELVVEVIFPAEYDVAYLKGRPATFDVLVNEVQTPRAVKADDDFAKSMGLEGIAQLRDLLKAQIEQELNGLTRTHMKRQLLDQLAAAHDFPVPESMVEAEFAQIWQQLEHEASHEEDPVAARAEMEKERGDYRAIAERRVRLGLLLSEIGQKNGVTISPQEMNQLITQAAQQYRAEERQRFVDYVRNDPMAAAQLRAPLFEDKVVDHLFAGAKISERKVSREALEAAIESEDGATPHVHGPGCGHDHEAKPRKAAAKKPAAKKAAAADKPAKKTPAKKPAKKA